MGITYKPYTYTVLMPPVTDKMKQHISEFEDKKKNVMSNKLSQGKGTLKFGMVGASNSHKDIVMRADLKRESSPDKDQSSPDYKKDNVGSEQKEAGK